MTKPEVLCHSADPPSFLWDEQVLGKQLDSPVRHESSPLLERAVLWAGKISFETRQGFFLPSYSLDFFRDLLIFLDAAAQDKEGIRLAEQMNIFIKRTFGNFATGSHFTLKFFNLTSLGGKRDSRVPQRAFPGL